jgi:DNA-binding GntR family transcriptional regulator
MAQNPYLVASLNRMLIDHTRLSQTFYRPASDAEKKLVTKASDQHDAMISAIEARETALVIDLTLQHWDLSRDRLEKYVKPDPLPLDVISLKDKRSAREG